MTDDGALPEEKEDKFKNLPLDLQRTCIDWCIANKLPEAIFEGKSYRLPELLQMTYRCSNTACNSVITSRFFYRTVINGGVAPTRRCPECRWKMYISHKTAVLDYYLGIKKEKLKGLMVHVARAAEDNRKKYGID